MFALQNTHYSYYKVCGGITTHKQTDKQTDKHTQDEIVLLNYLTQYRKYLATLTVATLETIERHLALHEVRSHS